MKALAIMVAGAAPAVAGTADASGSASNEKGEARLAHMLEGRVAGTPVSCINTSRTNAMQVIDGVAVVYDAYAGQMRLYVNGQLEQVPCSDADGDGVPDDPTCTEKVSWNSSVLPFAATKGLQLGRVKTGTSTWGEFWSGAVDDVWVLQGAVSDSQAARLGSGDTLDTVVGP